MVSLEKKRRQQAHSSHNQGLLNWSPANNASLMDHVIMYSFGKMSTSKCVLVLYPEKEVKMTVTSSERVAWRRGRQVSAENDTPST